MKCSAIWLVLQLAKTLLLQCVDAFQIREQIKQFGINIYQFPECDSDEEEDFKKQDQILKVLLLTSAFLAGEFLLPRPHSHRHRYCFFLLSAGQHPVCSNWE